MAELLETVMIVSFGASWPMNVMKSFKARMAKGKSLTFLSVILFGCVAGITAKLINPEYMANFSAMWYVLFFYVLNFVMVFTDLLLYFRNRRLDRAREGANA